MRHTVLGAGVFFLTSINVFSGAPPEKNYYHFSQNQSVLESLGVPDGGFFVVRIIDTCRPDFDARFFGIEKSTPIPEAEKAGTRRAKDALKGFHVACVTNGEPLVLEIPHNPKYGGYQIELKSVDGQPKVALKPKTARDPDSVLKALLEAYKEHAVGANAGADPNRCLAGDTAEVCWGKLPRDEAAIDKALADVGSVKELHDVTITIAVLEWGWQYEFAGGFTTSKLTDPEYGSMPCEHDAAQQCVFRDGDKESDARLGFAGFVHMSHSKSPNAALSFGLGINDSTGVSFFLGPSWRLGGKAFVTLGVNLGQIERLPTGVEVGKPISDPNLLNNPGSRTGAAAFLGFSYTFIGGTKDALEKPFQTPPAAPVTPAP